MKQYLKYFHPLGLLVAVLIITISWGFYGLYKSNLKFKYIIIANRTTYKTVKIDSVSNGNVYFKDRHGDNTIVSGSYVIKEINKNGYE